LLPRGLRGEILRPGAVVQGDQRQRVGGVVGIGPGSQRRQLLAQHGLAFEHGAQPPAAEHPLEQVRLDVQLVHDLIRPQSRADLVVKVFFGRHDELLDASVIRLIGESVDRFMAAINFPIPP
jgi:hypothetical protein